MPIRNLSDFDLKSLRIFCAIADAGGFTQAQTSLNMHLSKLSTTISDLEVRLGLKLCQRGRQGFQLTQDGLAVYEASRGLFSDIDRFIGNLGALHGQPAPNIHIGLVDGLLTLPQMPTAQALRRFREQLPQTQIHLHIHRPDELEKLVLEEKIAIAVGAFHHNLSGLVYTSAFQEEQSLYCATQHPLFASSDEHIAHSVADHDYVERGYMQESQRPCQIRLKKAAVAYTMEAISTLVLTGQYLGYLPSHYAQQWQQQGLLRALQPALFSYSSTFSIITRQGKTPDLASQLLQDCLLAATR